MKSFRKIVAWTLGSIVLLVILLVVGVRLFLPAETLRDLAVSRASAALGREVTVEDVRVSLRGGLGVQLTDVGIANPPGSPAGHLMTAESVDLKLRIRPLFSRQLHADRLVINAPTIDLVQFDAERNNYTFDEAEPDGAQKASSGDGAALNLERFECNDGVLRFRNQETGAGLAVDGLRLRWTVTDAGNGELVTTGETGADSLSITGSQALVLGPVTLAHAARMDARQTRLTLETGTLAIAGLELAVTADVGYGPDAPVTRAELVGEALDLAAILALVPAESAGQLADVSASGTLDLRAALTMDRTLDDPLAVEGTVELRDGVLEGPDLPDPVTNLSAVAAFGLDAVRVTNAQASVSGADLSFNGTVTGLRQTGEARVDGTLNLTADLADLQGYLPPERKAVLGGKTAGRIQLAGRLDRPGDLLSGGEITVTNLAYRDATIPEPVTNLNATITLGPRDVTLKNCTLRLESGDVSLSGVVRGLVPVLLAEATTRPDVDLSVNAKLFNDGRNSGTGTALPAVDVTYKGTVTGLSQQANPKTEGTLNLSLDLASFKGYLPAERKATLTGKTTGWVKLAGRLDRPREILSGGEITLTDLTYRDANLFEPITDLDAVVTLGPRDVTLKRCTVKLQPSNFTLTGVARDLVPALLGESGPKPDLTFTLMAQLFNADHLFPAASPGTPPLGAAGAANRPPVIAEFPDVTGSGTVTLANLIYGGVDFTDLTGTVTIADRTVNVTQVTGAVYAGEITGDTTVDLKDMTRPGYRGTFAARGIQADSLMSRFTPLKNHLFGALDFGGSYTAAGKDAATFRSTLSMDANGAMTQGRLVPTGVIQQGFTTLAKLFGRQVAAEQKLKDLAGPVKVADGRVIIERISTEVSDLGTLSLNGSYGMTGDLNFQGDLLLTEESSRKLLGDTAGGLTGTIGNLLGKKDPAPVSRLRLPVTIGGAFTRPDVALDFSSLAKSSGQEVVDDLKGKLEGMFKKK